MFLPVSIGLFLILISIWIIWRKRKMSLLERYGIPGPKPNFWLGNLMDFNEKKKDILLEWKKIYGKCYGFYLGAKPMLVISDAELLKMIQVKEFKNFANRDTLLPDMGVPHPNLQEAVFAIKDEKWKDTRSIITPAFTSGKLRKMMPTIDSIVDIFLKKLAEKGDRPFDIYSMIKNLSFDITGKTSFGIDTNVQNDDENILAQSIYRAFNISSNSIANFFSICFPELEPLPCKIRVITDIIRYYLNKPSMRIIAAISKKIIHTRKIYPETRTPDLLQNMIDANDPSTETEDENPDKLNRKKTFTLSDSTVMGNAIGFMLAGFEAISMATSTFIYQMARNPEVQQKLRDEINEAVGDKDHVTYEDISKMQYMDQVFSEVVRLTMLPTVSINRICEEEIKLKHITIPKGVGVIIPITMMNTDPEYWPRNMDFIPERFSPENSIDPVQYQPFGLGPRSCIGTRFAHLVVKQVMINILRKYKLEDCNECEDIEMEISFFQVRPKNGIIVRAFALNK